MANIPIEEYKGFEICYDIDHDKFECVVNIEDEQKKARQSLKELRNAIDDYIKSNKTFKPFYVIYHNEFGSRRSEFSRKKIIGIRKDGFFIYESNKPDENGKRKKEHISRWNEKDWIMEVPENEPLIEKIKELGGQAEKIGNEIEKLNKQIKRTTLSEVKEKYMGK